MKSSIEELLAFITVVDTGSIVAAADKLQQTPSGVSRSLTRLESKLGVTLLERTTRKMKLTHEGTLFVDKVRQILADFGRFESGRRRLVALGQRNIGFDTFGFGHAFCAACIGSPAAGISDFIPQN